MPTYLFVLTLFVLAFTVLSYLHSGVLVASAWRSAKRRSVDFEVIDGYGRGPEPSRLGVSVIMPAFNEGRGIVDSVRTALRQQYDRFEVVVVNDGSTDDTLDRLRTAFLLVPVPDAVLDGPLPTTAVRGVYRSPIEARLRVVDKEPSGSKAGACNAGINASSFPWVAIMDADELIEPDVLGRCMAAVRRSDRPVAAVGATLLPSNNCEIDDDGTVVPVLATRNYWVGCQTVEYLAAFLITRPAFCEHDALLFVSGGFGLFQRDALLAVGGYRPGHLGEDLDISIRIQRLFRERGTPYAFLHVPEAIVWTEFPDSFRVLARQRRRWHWGLCQVIADHHQVLRQPVYGRFGRIGYGTLHIKEWWGTGVETASHVLLTLILIGGWLNVPAFIALLVCVQALEMAISGFGLAILARHASVLRRTRDYAMILFLSVAAGWGYRQLNLAWRIQAALSRTREWGEMERGSVDTPKLALAQADRRVAA